MRIGALSALTGAGHKHPGHVVLAHCGRAVSPCRTGAGRRLECDGGRDCRHLLLPDETQRRIGDFLSDGESAG